MNKNKIAKLQKELKDLNNWIGAQFTEPECAKINRLVEIELLLEAESNK